MMATTNTRTSADGSPSAVTVAVRSYRAAARGELPSRYASWWHKEYDDQLQRSFREGITILDVGAGRNPSIPPEHRPRNSRYIGLDLSQSELYQSP